MVDFLRRADFLKSELQEFYQRLRCGGNRAVKKRALARLRAAVGQVEGLAEDPDYRWETLSFLQRQGYLQLVFQVERASRALKKYGPAACH